MLPSNRQHMKKVAVWGGGAACALALASLFKFPPVVAFGIITGAALSLANLYSIIMLVEALAGAAAAGMASGRASKALTTMIHVFKLVLVLVILVLLVVFKLTNLFALLAGFTVVLLSNLVAGLSGLKGEGEGE